MLKCRKATAQ